MPELIHRAAAPLLCSSAANSKLMSQDVLLSYIAKQASRAPLGPHAHHRLFSLPSCAALAAASIGFSLGTGQRWNASLPSSPMQRTLPAVAPEVALQPRGSSGVNVAPWEVGSLCIAARSCGQPGRGMHCMRGRFKASATSAHTDVRAV